MYLCVKEHVKEYTYVCMYACMYVCMYASMYACTNIGMYVYENGCIHACFCYNTWAISRAYVLMLIRNPVYVYELVEISVDNAAKPLT